MYIFHCTILIFLIETFIHQTYNVLHGKVVCGKENKNKNHALHLSKYIGIELILFFKIENEKYLFLQ